MQLLEETLCKNLIDLLIDVFTSFLFYLSLPGNIKGQNHQKTIGLQIGNVLRKSHPPPHWLAKAHSFEKAAITKKAFVETGSSFADLTIWKLRFFGPKFWSRIYSGLPCWPSHRQIQTNKCLSIQKVPGQAKAEKILSCKIFIPFKSVKHEDVFFSWSHDSTMLWWGLGSISLFVSWSPSANARGFTGINQHKCGENIQTRKAVLHLKSRANSKTTTPLCRRTESRNQVCSTETPV